MAPSSRRQRCSSAPHLSFDPPRSEHRANTKSHPVGWLLVLVEPRGIEPLSESNLEGTSPGAVCYLHSLIPAGTNTLRESVAS